jgi:hypothetical protein
MHNRRLCGPPSGLNDCRERRRIEDGGRDDLGERQRYDEGYGAWRHCGRDKRERRADRAHRHQASRADPVGEPSGQRGNETADKEGKGERPEHPLR